MIHADDRQPGFKWPIAVTHSIPTPAADVWAAISMPGNLELCHPFCESNPVMKWPGPESRDQVHYLSGWVYERRFRNWIESVGYDLHIGRPGGRTSFVSWRIEPTDAQHCDLTVSIRPHALQHLSTTIRWLPHLLWLRPRLNSYLSSVVQGFEWYVTRGEPVPRNHFGRHPWFSAPP